MKRGSFKASELQPGHKAAPAHADAAAAAALDEEEEEGGGGREGGGRGGGDYGFVAPAPPLVGGAGGGKGELPEGMYFIGIGVFMMEVMQ